MDATIRPVLEVCVGSLDDALAAQRGGADRLELCGALELGGLTPSMGLVQQVLGEIDLPVVVMIRPRAAGFAYSTSEFACMRRDAECVLDAGASGVVFGPLTAAGEVDRASVESLVELAGAAETVFHKAFDAVRSLPAALDTLIAAGVTRVLTSGGAATAMDGRDVLRGLVAQAAGRIEILPGGGVAADQVPELLSHTGCAALHIGASVGRLDPSTPAAVASQLNDLRRLAAGAYRAVDREIVASVRHAAQIG